MKFFDRTEQLAQLREMKNRSYDNHSMLTVVTGRRRIGKTTLIDKSMSGEEYLYFFVGKKNEAVLCAEFTGEIRTKLGLFVPDGITSFKDIFAILMQVGEHRKFTLVIDEFQNFSEVNPSIFSDIQNYWDQFRLKTNVNLIVSGSIYSLMTKLFRDKKEPLYGRDDHTIKLHPFAPSVLKEVMHEYAPGYTNDDLLALYAYTGGVPKYIELFVDAEALTKDGMIRYICKPDSPFIEEGRKLLIQEFGRKYGTYFSILEAISEGYNTQAEIATYLGSKSIGGQLSKLEETYNLIGKKRPMWAGSKSQTVRYGISDVFLRFWFRYIEKNQMMIEIGQYPLLAKVMSDDYTTYTGDTLERYFKAKMMEGMNYRAIGSWWDPKGYTDSKGNHQQCEIDIVAVSSDDKNAEIIEVKRNPEKFDKETMEEKVRFFIQKEKRIRRYKRTVRCLSLEDM
jgi:AAA+ ATPase superfamily predicted ATPase